MWNFRYYDMCTALCNTNCSERMNNWLCNEFYLNMNRWDLPGALVLLNLWCGKAQVCYSFSPIHAQVGTQIFLFHTDPLACFSKLSQWPAFSCWSALAINYWCLWLYTSMCPYHRHNYQTLPQQCQPCENITMNTICADTDSAISLLLVSKAANNLTKFGSQRWTFSFSKFQTRRELRHILL